MSPNGSEDLHLPDWLEVDSLLPTLGEWKAQSSVTGHIRSHSPIAAVDVALEAFWTALCACLKGSFGAPTPAVVKEKLEGVRTALDTYLCDQTSLTPDVLTRALGEDGDPRLQTVATNFARTYIKNSKKERVPAAVGLRWTCNEEKKRLEPWTTGQPPRADVTAAWGGFTTLPSLEIWKYESSGGADKNWTRRARSQITKVDAALEKWWGPFLWLQKDECLELLDALIAAAKAYLEHKQESTDRSDKKPRVGAVQRLLFRAQQEKERLKAWTILVPPRVPGFSLTEGAEVDPFASGDAFMELRTMLPTPDLWKEQSSVTGKIRSHSSIVRLIDRPLERFWDTFVKKDRLGSLVVLCDVTWGARAYVGHKGGEGPRVEAAQELATLASEEFTRLLADWPTTQGALPPIVNDNDSDDEPEVLDAVAPEVKLLEGEVDESALRPVDGTSVSAFVNERIGEGAESTDEQRMANLLGDKKGAWFGRKIAYAQVLIAPREASDRILKLYGSEKKWVKRQLAAIQACSIVNYPKGCQEKLKGKADLKKKHEEFFEKVVSLADHVARTVYNRTKASPWEVLKDLGWTDKSPDIVLPMVSISTILFACKWKDSKSATIVGGVTSYGVKRAIATGLGFGLTLTTSTEAVYKLAEGCRFIGSLDSTLGGLSVFGVASAGINVPLSIYAIIDSIKSHHALNTMLDRFGALATAQPGVAALIDSSPFFYRIRLSLASKLGRRKTRAKITGVASTASVASTVVGIAATVAVANAWNPVGWVLCGIGAAGSIGLLIYKIKKKSIEKQKLLDLRTKYHIPPFVKTAGEWERYQIADLMFRAALNDGSMGIQLLAVGYALLFLIFGGSMQEARDSALKMGHVGIMGFIKG